jgi:hypothetical protein
MQNDFVSCVLADTPDAPNRADLPEQVRHAVQYRNVGSVAVDDPESGRRVYWHWDTYDVVT